MTDHRNNTFRSRVRGFFLDLVRDSHNRAPRIEHMLREERARSGK
ncbi:hypothetical protein FP2506_18399 [Fulvimarina pelagi HTCC2506]|uniref:Uncharacterized protein n=1 Tax=Fulvimarina pelagi HTCC2506 TaxID=314231 RepID=Q0G0V3_9HYPH|nr:hypothetical protein [Fulvimarina pelagi]EAU40886.1 hypothetical protein FP2506_18399 [Fulvimarina pelagi HTCC2506]